MFGNETAVWKEKKKKKKKNVREINHNKGGEERKKRSERWDLGRGLNVLFADFVKDEPAVVSAAITSRILNDSPFGFVQALGAKWVVSGQGAKFA